MGKIKLRKTIKHILDYRKTINYVIDHIDSGKTLSHIVLKTINFKLGNFFTILPKDAFTERIYEFSYGGILPIRSDKQNNFSKIIYSLGHEYARFCWNFLQKNKDSYLLLENVMAESTDSNLEINKIKPLLFKNEVYYLLKNENSKKEILIASNLVEETWHFLALLCIKHFSKKKNLNKDDLKISCEQVKYIIIGAYDGEGYLFWEKN